MKNGKKYGFFYWTKKQNKQIILNYNHKFKLNLSCQKQSIVFNQLIQV